MSVSAIIFYVIAAFILATGLLAVSAKKIFRAAIWLLFSLVGIAALFFWMQVEFIAAVQIIVYVGGIVVLIIFSIFLTHQSGSDLPSPPLTRKLFSILAALFGVAFTCSMVGNYFTDDRERGPFHVTMSDIGTQMLSTTEYGYLLPFEVVSFLLLAAMIGCIVIAMRSPENNSTNTNLIT